MAPSDALASVLTRTTRSWPVVAAAQDLLAVGVPVFPCVPGGKRPLTRRGFHDATIDPDQVAAWWRRYPNANIGVPTGAISGVVVVDVDVHGPVSGFEAFARAHRAGLVGGWQVLVDTPSGGMHAYYPAAPGLMQRSWQAAQASVDFRGDGGYVVVPPSMVSVEGVASSYRVRQVNTGPARTVDSQGLRNFLDPRPTPIPRPVTGGPRRVDVSRLASWVAGRGEGERNRGLFWAACRLAENDVPPATALDVLAAAAQSVGLSEREIVTTVRSAYRTISRTPSAPRRRDSSRLTGDGWFSRAIMRPPGRAREL